jgi:hypothetical protein
MAERKRLSGFQYRKRKAEKDKFISEQKGSFLKYLCHEQIKQQNAADQEEAGPGPSSEADYLLENSCNNYDVEENVSEIRTEEVNDESVGTEEELNVSMLENQDNLESESALDFNDPATWPDRCDDTLRVSLVQHGPHQEKDIDFPLDIGRRRFSKNHYKRQLANGESVCRTWLLYSKSNDLVFCFCCKLFFKSTSPPSLCSKGTNDWKNIAKILSNHEKSDGHITCFHEWKELELRLNKNKTIDDENLRLMKQEEKYWKGVLERIIALVRVLGAQNLALRGKHEKLFTAGNGNFLKFLEYLALFDPLMHEHLRKIQDNETKVHYLSKDVQNEMIKLLANAVQAKIISLVHAAKYYSIILDCTPDVSHTEQMTVIVRFVAITETTSEIREHFLGFIPLTETTGASLTEAIVEKLKELELCIDDLRGQGYDNGSNMKGKHSGVQKRIKEINPRAFYVPCSSHSLNLVVNDAAHCCLEATKFFALVQEIYVYFSASTQRWNTLKKHVTNLTLKPLSETRWESRIDALIPLRYQLGDVHNALMDIYEDRSLNGPTGNNSRVQALGLAKNIEKYNFVVSVVLWHSILFEINITSKQLQSKQFDLAAAKDQLSKTKLYLQKLRCDDGFGSILVDARGVAEELNIQPTFETETLPTRLKKKKKQFDYEADDEPLVSPQEHFKVNFHFAILDTAISSLDERFQQLEEVTSIFGFLYNISKVNAATTKSLMDDCMNLEHFLSNNEAKDIEGHELCNEVQAIARRVPKNANPQDVLNFIISNDLKDCAPNLSVALRILLTLPVSVASGERSFSKLKLIKTYIRSTMTQERLQGLATLSIEQDLAKNIDLNELVTSFTKMKLRKNKL